MLQLWARAPRPRFFVIVAAVSVIGLAASSLIYSAVRGSHVTRHTAASSGVARGVILTASRTGFGESAPDKVVLARSDGSGSRILASGYTLSSVVSPDGSRVAVHHWVDNQPGNERLELFASVGGRPAHVIAVECGQVDWSPDSTKLACVAFAVERKPPWPEKLLVIDAATAAVTTLATGFFDFRVSFSPDSTRLAYVQKTSSTVFRSPFRSAGKLKLINLATKAITTVRGAAAGPVWGPKAIAFSVVKQVAHDDIFNVALVRPDGSGFRQLTHFRPNVELGGVFPVAWSADGKRLLGDVTGLDGFAVPGAYAIDPIRGGSRVIARGVYPFVLSRDGRYVIGQTQTAADAVYGGSNIVRVPWAGGKKQVLLRDAVWPSFNG
jgi:hypothetical protein